MPILFLLFVVMPIMEMSILISVGQKVGAVNTIGLVLLTAVIGSMMLRQQGLSTLFKAREKMDAGEVPAKEMAEGIMLAVGGAFLITPGFVTDTIGFLCLLPFTRQWIIGKLMSSAISAAYFSQTRTRSTSFTDKDERSSYHETETRFEDASQSPFKSHESHHTSQTLDGEFRRED